MCNPQAQQKFMGAIVSAITSKDPAKDDGVAQGYEKRTGEEAQYQLLTGEPRRIARRAINTVNPGSTEDSTGLVNEARGARNIPGEGSYLPILTDAIARHRSKAAVRETQQDARAARQGGIGDDRYIDAYLAGRRGDEAYTDAQSYLDAVAQLDQPMQNEAAIFGPNGNMVTRKQYNPDQLELMRQMYEDGVAERKRAARARETMQGGYSQGVRRGSMGSGASFPQGGQAGNDDLDFYVKEGLATLERRRAPRKERASERLYDGPVGNPVSGKR